jgi:hypothetical protein
MSRVDEAEASVIVRVWFEDYPQHPIRFVVSTVGRGLPEARKATTSIDDACAAVRDALVSLTEAETGISDNGTRLADS